MPRNLLAICAVTIISGCVSGTTINQQQRDLTNQERSSAIAQSGNQSTPRISMTNGFQEGERNFFYPDGQPWLKCNYHAGKLHGPWKVFYPDGAVEETGNYLDGKRQEQWVWYYPDGKVYIRGYFVADERDGTWESFNSKGELWWKGPFLQGQKHGAWEAWSGGVRVEEANFSHGARQGVWRSFYSNGKVQLEGQFQRGAKTGLWHEYDQLGHEIRSVDVGHSEPLEPSPYEQNERVLVQAERELRTRLEPTFQVDIAGSFLIASEAPKFKSLSGILRGNQL